MDGTITRLKATLRSDSGFTLIEVMMAATLLIIGLLGTVTMIDDANSTTWSTKAREQAVSLQREIIEESRSIAFDQLTPNGVGALLRARTGLSDSNLGTGGWTIRRRGFTYAVAVGVCSIDDARDGTGTHDGGLFCASGSGATAKPDCASLLGVTGSIQGTAAAASAGVDVGNCGIDLNLDGAVDNLTEASVGICLGICVGASTDSTPADYKRIIVLVRWDRGKGQRFALQSTTVPNPGIASAPAVVSLTTTAAIPVTSATSVPFAVTTNRAPSTVAWYVDGTQKGTATGSGTAWTFPWALGNVSSGSTPNSNEILDGSYLIGAKAFDQYGQFGSTRALTVTLNRRQPYPVNGFLGGRNAGAVEFEWTPNRERDIQGYRIYRQPTVGAAVVACALLTVNSCRDTSPPTSALVNYFAVAVDKDAGGSLREGQQSAAIGVTLLNNPPPPPTGLIASSSSGNTVLLWSAPSTGDPDVGDSIAFYRIYRDGATYADRYDRTSTGSITNFTDTATGGQTHTYRVTAVDTQLAESTVLGPVTR